MSETVLITGGAGFIGSHLADELLEAGCHVRVLDSLHPQVHGELRKIPEYVSRDVEFLQADVRDADRVRSAVRGADSVVHLAAAVGVGQSMYQIAHYTGVNDLGTAVLLEAVAQHPVERLLVASSMSIYGEGTYRNARGEIVGPEGRSRAALEQGMWDYSDGEGDFLEPLPTSESKVPVANSVYALSKYVQERMCLIFGGAYRIPTVALRFFNVYGPRQALSNPYTGALAIFSARYLRGEPPLIFEDGLQQRDFVNVHDVARACRLALTAEGVGGEVFNIGSGNPVTILDVALRMGEVLHRQDVRPKIIGKYRVGDIRHCFADISKARDLLRYQPQIGFADGMAELAEWLIQQDEVDDQAGRAHAELSTRGLVV